MKPPFIVTTSIDREYGGTSHMEIQTRVELIVEISKILTEDSINNNLVEIKIEPLENYISEEYGGI